jgi:DNA-binding transcriptional LysR family regulator
MNIQQLRYLSALAENETLTAAAKFLGISQPVISRALRELENELKTPVLKRSGRRLLFTKEGKEILAAARRAIGAFDDVGRTAMVSRQQQVLRIGICHSTFVQLLPVLRRLIQRLPELHVKTCHAASVDEMLQLLRDGAVDVCFGTAVKVGHRVAFTPYEDLETVLLSPPGTALPPTVTIQDLAGQPLICLLPGRERAQLVDNVCLDSGFSPNYVLECNDPSAFVDAVRDGLGSAFGWRSVGETALGVEMRCFTPPRITPVGFYHLKKPALQVRLLLSLAGQMKFGQARSPADVQTVRAPATRRKGTLALVKS